MRGAFLGNSLYKRLIRCASAPTIILHLRHLTRFKILRAVLFGSALKKRIIFASFVLISWFFIISVRTKPGITLDTEMLLYSQLSDSEKLSSAPFDAVYVLTPPKGQSAEALEILTVAPPLFISGESDFMP